MGDGAALCQGDEHNGGGKRVFVPCIDPSCKAPNCKSVGPSAVGPCPHFSCIAPSLNPPSTHPYLTNSPPYPPCIGACRSMPHQCGQPRSLKCSEATSGLRCFVGFGLVKVTVLSHGQESFPDLCGPGQTFSSRTRSPHGQSLSTVRRSAPWTELSLAKLWIKLCQANVRCFAGPSSLAYT